MTDIYTFTCEMPIVAKERHRVSIVRSKSSPTAIRAHMYTPSTTKAFEEELKFIGSQYRTRQTIISRSGEQLMIGQYLEKRIEER